MISEEISHIPGPWFCPQREFFGGGYMVFNTPVFTDATICIASALPETGYTITRTKAQAQANALLIAAAPEMLEVLEIFANPPKTSYGARIIEESSYEKARNIIRKAKGM